MSLRELRGKQTLGGSEFSGPSCPSAVDFIRNAKKKQILFANLEGSHKRRILEVEDFESLKTFVACTLNCEEFFDGRHNSEEVVKLTNKMIDVAKRYHLFGKIHYSAIWIYLFDYANAKMISIPVFKVFKNIAEPDAVFIDDNCREYKNWDEFLDQPRAYKSLMCVPRMGHYAFCYDDGDSKMLDLIYIRSKLGRCQAFPWFGRKRSERLRKPFFEWVFNSVCKGRNFLTTEMMPHVKLSIKMLSDPKIKMCVVVASACVVVALIVLRSKYTLLKYCLKMLLDVLPSLLTDGESNLIANLVNWSRDAVKLHGNLTGPSSFSLSAFQDENLDFKSFIDQLPDSKNMKDKSLKDLEFFSLILRQVLRHFSKAKPSEIESDEKNGNGNKQMVRNNSQFDTVLCQKLTKFFEVVENGEAEEFSLSIAEEIKANEGNEVSEPVCFPVGPDFHDKIHVFQNAPYDEIIKGLKDILKNFRIHPRQSLIHDVTDDQGNILGTLYFCKNGSFLWLRDSNQNEATTLPESSAGPAL